MSQTEYCYFSLKSIFFGFLFFGLRLLPNLFCCGPFLWVRRGWTLQNKKSKKLIFLHKITFHFDPNQPPPPPPLLVPKCHHSKKCKKNRGKKHSALVLFYFSNKKEKSNCSHAHFSILKKKNPKNHHIISVKIMSNLT